MPPPPPKISIYFPSFSPTESQSRGGECIPSESTDDHSREHHVTRSAQYQSPVERSQCDEAGEPEQAGQGVQSEYEPFVEEAAVGVAVVVVAAAGEDGVEKEVGEDEEGEGCDGDEVGGRCGGGGGVGVVEVPGCY